MKKMLYAAFIVAALADMTNASAQAAAAKRGGVCVSAPSVVATRCCSANTSAEVIKQIYEKGFRVVHMQDDKNTATYVMLVIEEQ